jgi:hypothetical protein
MSENEENFRAELKELLKKYNAEIQLMGNNEYGYHINFFAFDKYCDYTGTKIDDGFDFDSNFECGD